MSYDYKKLLFVWDWKGYGEEEQNQVTPVILLGLLLILGEVIINKNKSIWGEAVATW